MGWESKPSSVPDGHLSRPQQRDRPRRRLRGGSRLPASASNLLAADSEIAAGRIALFTPAVARRFGLCCSRAARRAPIWTVDARETARLPGFHRAPMLCARRRGGRSRPPDSNRRPAVYETIEERFRAVRRSSIMPRTRGFYFHSVHVRSLAFMGVGVSV